MMMTTTTNTTSTTSTTSTNTAQQRTKRTPEQQGRWLRDCWWNRVHGALFKRMKRNALAANALFGTPGWVEPDMQYFMAEEEREVTSHAALVEECLDDARAHAKRKSWRPIPLEYLPSGILESEALEPYLKRWKRDNDAAAAAAAAAPTRAHCGPIRAGLSARNPDLAAA